ncbi:MAG TPA: polysaccharide deacetylase family protein [Burkholderiales bacterium]|nr:polysaccharide deacetylase family protein [Burkholderiales bacterium]
MSAPIAIAASPRPEPRPWRPAPAIQISMALHAAGAAALAVAPAAWPWVLGGILANHAALTGACFLPRSGVLGANLARLPAAAARRNEVALTFDDGPDPEVTPRVLDGLDEAGMKATFFLVGERAARHSALAREIVRRGHAVENHSHRHSKAFACFGIARMRRDVEAAQAAIADAAGVAPVFFRAPFGIRSPLLDPALARCGLHYVSWTRRGFDTVARDPERVLERLARVVAAGDIFLLHDGIAVRSRSSAAHAPEILPALGARLAALGLRSVTLRAACGGDDGA